MEEIVGEHPDAFALKFSGYEFVSELGEGHADAAFGEVSGDAMDDLSIISDAGEIRESRPYLADSVSRIIRVSRAGALDVNAMGSWLLRQARRAGVELVAGEVASIQRVEGGGFEATLEQQGTSSSVSSEQLVLAAGAFFRTACQRARSGTEG